MLAGVFYPRSDHKRNFTSSRMCLLCLLLPVPTLPPCTQPVLLDSCLSSSSYSGSRIQLGPRRPTKALMQMIAASTRSLLSSLMKAALGNPGFHVAVAGIPVEDGSLREELRRCLPAGLASKPGSVTYSNPRLATQLSHAPVSSSLVAKRLQEDDIGSA